MPKMIDRTLGWDSVHAVRGQRLGTKDITTVFRNLGVNRSFLVKCRSPGTRLKVTPGKRGPKPRWASVTSTPRPGTPASPGSLLLWASFGIAYRTGILGPAFLRRTPKEARNPLVQAPRSAQ